MGLYITIFRLGFCQHNLFSIFVARILLSLSPASPNTVYTVYDSHHDQADNDEYTKTSTNIYHFGGCQISPIVIVIVVVISIIVVVNDECASTTAAIALLNCCF